MEKQHLYFTKIIPLLTLLAIPPAGFGIEFYSAGNNKNSFGVASSSQPAPIPVYLTNLSDIETTISQGIADIWTVNPSSLLYNTLAMQGAASSIITAMLQPENNAASNISTALQTGVNSSPGNSVVIYNLNDSVNYVYQGIFSPITTLVSQELSQNTSLNYVEANQNSYAYDTPSTNYTNTLNAESAQQNSSSSTTQKLSLLLTDNATTNYITSPDGFGGMLALLELYNAQIASCAASIVNQNLVANSPSTSSTASSSTSTNSTVGNTIADANDNLACNSNTLACMQTNLLYNIYPSINILLNSTGYGINLATDYPNLYKSLNKNLTDSALTNIKNTYTTNTSEATCIGTSTDYNTNSTTQLSNVKTVLASSAKITEDIRNVVKILIVNALSASAQEQQNSGSMSNTSTNSNNITQITSFYAPLSLDTLIKGNSYYSNGNVSNCSTKTSSTTDEAKLASSYINNVVGLDTLPSPIALSIPIIGSDVFFNGGVAAVNDTNFSSSDQQSITSNRTSTAASLKAQAQSYTSMYKTFIQSSNIGSNILAGVYNNRANYYSIPPVYDSSGNPINTNSSGESNPGYIVAGSQCSPQEVDYFNSNWRSQAVLSSDGSTATLGQWQQNIAAQPNVGEIQREQVLLLADIAKQQHEVYLQLQQELAVLSVMQLAALAPSVANLIDIHNEIEKTSKNYLLGGKPSSTN